MRSLRLRDGRTLAWDEYGDPAGRPAVVLHGTPGTRLTFALLDEPARAGGVRLIAPDRPGYGGSDPTAPSFTGYAEDLRQLLDELVLDEVVVAGVSGGGGYALASGAVLPDRVSRLVLLCAMVPGAPRSSRQGRSPAMSVFFLLARRAPWLLARLFARQPAASADSRALRLAPVPDRRVLGDPSLQPQLLAANAEALRQGPAAAVAEAALMTRPLPFSLHDVAVPVELVHGRLDANVPPGVAEWAASQLPHAHLSLLDDAAHLFLVERPEQLLSRVP